MSDAPRQSTARRAGAPVLLWFAFNATLAGVLILFGSLTHDFELGLYWGSAGLVLLTAALVWLPGRRDRPRSAPAPVTGAPALAVAVACLIGGLAWVFGIWLAYLAAPLVVFVLARLWAEHRGRRT